MDSDSGLSYEFGRYRLLPDEYLLLRHGRPVPLTPKAFDVLRLLVEHGGHLVEKDRLLKDVWSGSFVDEGTLSRSVSVLRKTLGEGGNERYIETVPTLGYRFVAPVSIVRSDSLPSFVAPPSSRRRASTSWRVASIAAAAAAIGVGVAAALLAPRLVRDLLSAPRDAHRHSVAPVHRQVTFTGKEGSPTLSPDGKRVAYVSATPLERTIRVQELAGGRPLAVFSAPEVGRIRWSPDGSALLYWVRGDGRDGLFVMPQLGGTPVRIAARQYVGSWSPDGSTIAVAYYLRSKIAFVDMQGRERRSVTLAGAHRWFWDLDWSPATNELLFVSDDDQRRFAIWRMKADGTNQERVFVDDGEISAARWSPRGDAIYFFRRVNQTVSLFKVAMRDRAAATSDAVPLLTGLETDGSFSFSANGTQLVYARAPFHSNLWLVDATGSATNARVVTKQLTSGTSLVERPRVSPDGRSVVFTVGHASLANLYTMPLTGGAPKQLTFFNALSAGAVWSSDGASLAFGSTEGGTPRVWIVNAAGGTPRAVSSGAMSDSFEIASSSDSLIAYQQAGNRNFYLLDPQRGAERLLVDNGGVGWMFSPVFSPDATRVVVAWNRRPTPGLWLIDRKNARQAMLYEGAPLAQPIAWSRDGNSIYALDGKRATYRGTIANLGETLSEARILRIAVKSGTPQTVMALPFDEVGGVDMAADGRFVCTVYWSRSDVWIVEHFDDGA
jgi:Tol biopolymer transport system component/DNA-binding winged helix-turn-helix (wHTH) protein